MVSIRMPSSLIQEIKKLSSKQHFMDVSELIRSVVREKWIQTTNPHLYELKKLRQDIESELKKNIIKKTQQQVIVELKKIKDQIKKGELLK